MNAYLKVNESLHWWKWKEMLQMIFFHFLLVIPDVIREHDTMAFTGIILPVVQRRNIPPHNSQSFIMNKKKPTSPDFLTACQSYLNHVNDPASRWVESGGTKSQRSKQGTPQHFLCLINSSSFTDAMKRWQRKIKPGMIKETDCFYLSEFTGRGS